MRCPIVFDLDGTLIDSLPDIRAGVNKALAQIGVAPLSADKVRSFVGGGVDVLWDRIVAATGIDPAKKPDLMAAFMAGYESSHTETTLYPGVLDALRVLKDQGHPLGICTNKPLEPAISVLQHMGIIDFFDTIIGGDSTLQKKPDPLPLKVTFDALGGPGIYVGDSEFDALTAERLQSTFLLFTEGYRNAPAEDLYHTALFHDYSELPALIAAICKESCLP